MDYFTVLFLGTGIGPQLALYLSIGITVLVIASVCLLLNFIVKKAALNMFAGMEKRSKYNWGEVLIKRKLIQRLFFLIPGIVIYFTAPVFKSASDSIQKLALTYISIVVIFVAGALLDSVNDYYSTLPVSNIRPIKGFIQVLKITVVAILTIVIVANLMGKSPILLLSGLGALAAVFSFVFKDLILGLVAGIQLTSNDMLRIGDWIEVPKFGADGEVVELSLSTVKVQNFDKTIVSLPAYALISDSFKNWRGMQDSGGRRIKRSIYIDTESIRFCTEEMMGKFKKFACLLDYIKEKETEISKYNEQRKVDEETLFNGRRFTNIGMFRMYVKNYIKSHPGFNKNLGLMVRQLPPGENGLPLEVYGFADTTVWEVYEGIQSDVFDHLLAIIGEFELRVFQNPTGYDVRQLNNRMIDCEKEFV